jgi:hypothetical protein
MTRRSIPAAPRGTTAVAVKAWGDTYAVAAAWPEASAPVYQWLGDCWDITGRQVADYRHCALAALRALLREVSRAGGDEIDDDALDALVAEATYD